jgi:hypothetical protein
MSSPIILSIEATSPSVYNVHIKHRFFALLDRAMVSYPAAVAVGDMPFKIFLRRELFGALATFARASMVLFAAAPLSMSAKMIHHVDSCLVTHLRSRSRGNGLWQWEQVY